MVDGVKQGVIPPQSPTPDFYQRHTAAEE